MKDFEQHFYQHTTTGAHVYAENGVQYVCFSYASQCAECGVVLFDRESGKEVNRYAFDAKNQIGSVYYMVLEDFDTEKLSYLFYEKDELVSDKKAKCIIGNFEYGLPKEEAAYKAGFGCDSYDWEQDVFPGLTYEESIGYCMHVRGFTKHSSSGVKAKGTFAGIIEKISYLKDLGITTLELQPAYEFNECPEKVSNEVSGAILKSENKKLNYWGYQDAYYYCPKKTYAASKDAGTEFKNLVKALHKNSMEIVMQFYFPTDFCRSEIIHILRFWHMNYHVDGFHLLGEGLTIKDIATDPFLSKTKIWYEQFPMAEISSALEVPKYPHLAVYNDGYLYDMRKFLKGDEGTLYNAMKQMRSKPKTHGVVNYFTNYYGFTMADLCSYERKHNEENGEDNRDGNDCNYSWNCGAEGPTRKKQVLLLREKQMKNAFTLLFLSQGMPLIFMGDEFGNSQKGNNNPYCQDNEITWLNWKDLIKNQKLTEYFKGLIALRKENQIFRMPKECMIMDYKACGFPDLSYHGEEAWKPSWEHYVRHIGFMLCGRYEKEPRELFYYVAVNMHWEEHEFALPKLPKGMQWEVSVSTEETKVSGAVATEVQADKKVILAPRSIQILLGK